MDGHGIFTFTGAAGVPEQEWYRIDYGGVGGSICSGFCTAVKGAAQGNL
jgi:hypothetical protein